nr:hypothetical protein [Desulfobacterales bacterium]
PCRLLYIQSGTCRYYHRRRLSVPTCQRLSASQISDCRWLPCTCAYRRLAEGRTLPEWHPLISGDPESVHHAGISVRNYPLQALPPEKADLEHYIVDWGIWERWRRRK